MLAICYMNSKCLSLIETTGEQKDLFNIYTSNKKEKNIFLFIENPLNSIRPIEGDRFSFLILESLKTVASFYGEQVIVLQYLTHVSNTVKNFRLF